MNFILLKEILIVSLTILIGGIINMDENKIILSSKENIQNIIVKGNDVLVDELIKNDSTVYGIIVDNIEQNKENIDNTINNIAGYFAANKALAITREYEESRNLREK